MYTYHLQHLIFDAAEMVGISRDLAYASAVLGNSNNVKFPLAWGTVLQSIKPIWCIAQMRVLWWDSKLLSLLHWGRVVETCMLLGEVVFCFSSYSWLKKI